MYDIDLFDNGASVVAALHCKGQVVCYAGAGTWGDWRPDANQFPAEVIGKDDRAAKGRNRQLGSHLWSVP